jgi:hypothetical protein
VRLSNYEGDLYNTINRKHEYIKQQSEKIDEEIAEYREKIKRLNELKIKDIKELRALYILQVVKQINSGNNYYGITFFQFNNKNYNLEQIMEDDIFPYLIDNKTTLLFGNPWQNRCQIQFNFEDIENKVNAKYTYKEREQQINDWNDDKIKELKQKISALEQKKNELRQAKINKLFSDKNIPIELKDNNQKLINTLLRNGYIAEDYLDYISLFHEGSLSKNDFTFLLNVKSQTNTDFRHNLDHIENLIKKIHIDDFGKDYILNYKFVDFILNTDNYEEQKKSIFSLLKDEKKYSIAFIDGFLNSGYNSQFFIRELCHYWVNIWNYFTNPNNYLVYLKDTYFSYIIDYSDIKNIKQIADNSTFQQTISECKDFCNLAKEERIKEILKTLDIKFVDIDTSKISDNLLDYIIENNHYSINIQLIRIILRKKIISNRVDIDIRNYYAIKNSNCNSLITYIDSNISEYINNVYLKLEANTQEGEEYLIELLNNSKLTGKDKSAIIQKVETKISDLIKIDDIEIDNILLKNSKVKPVWKNVINNFVRTENEMSEYVVEFLNNKENAETLSKTQIEKEKPNKETVDKFLEAFLLNEDINNNSYALILKSVPYFYRSLAFESLSEDKVKLLIDNNKLKLNEENYLKLKENFINLQTRLIEKRRFELSDIVGSLDFEDSDIVALLNSSILSFKEKEEILNNYPDTNIIGNTEILKLIGEILMSNIAFDVSKDVKKAILTKSKLKIDDKMLLFNNINTILDNKDIAEILLYFPKPYCNISENGKRPLLQSNSTIESFVKILKSKNYIKDYKSDKKGIRISTFRK